MLRTPLWRLLFLVAACLVAISATPHLARAADPLDPSAVPGPLKPWTDWVLDDKDDRGCPVFLAHADISRCVWPARVDLDLDEHDGRFTQQWHVDAKRWVAVPGDEKRWPDHVAVDGHPAVVVLRDSAPGVQLSRGDHMVSGTFSWDSLPESLAVPPESGLLSLRVRGKPVASPVRDAAGTVWLQKAAANEEGDALEFVVHRKVTDDIPLVLVTRIELHVSGKNREELLGRALPDDFVPTALDSPLPARLEAEGRLRVQLRPGVYTLELSARSTRLPKSLSRPDPRGPWRDGDEVWVFEAKPDLRIVSVEGGPAIDPQQTTLPDAWKRLPAYAMKLGTILTLAEQRRGDADPPPNSLALVRTLWLDFDGGGYAARDEITGTLSRDSRLTMDPPTVLGRVSIGGADQFITHLRGEPRTGVEVRQGQLVVSADSRIPGDPSDIPAVSWAHDFHQVSGTLNLPPGWRLIHASGVDEVPGTWVHRWSLLELFLALIIAIAIGRMYGSIWGGVALVLLVLTVPEPGAPKWSWLFVLATEALFRALPAGLMKKLLEGGRLAALIVVALIAVPFLVDHVREGLYPALSGEVKSGPVPQYEPTDALRDALRERGGGEQAPAEGHGDHAVTAAAPPKAAAEALNAQSASALGRPSAPPPAKQAARQQSNAQVYDPAAVVQTGAGVPQWRWTPLDMRWSGPVASTQRLRLYLLSPLENLVLAFVRAALLVVVVLRLLPWTQRLLPPAWGAAAIGCAILVLLPAQADAQLPDKAMLQELQERLTRPPDCQPSCAASGRMDVEIRAGVLRARMGVDAVALTAVPLPGSVDQWSPTQVLLDGKAARGLARLQDGVLWLEVGPGAHQVMMEGAMPDRESVQLPLHMKPHRVSVTAEGWTVAGVHEDGLADDDVQLSRVRTTGTTPDAFLQPGTLPPFVRVERTVQAGLNWQVDTQVVRVTPPGAAVVLEVPLLAGENVTTADVRVVGGKALVNMGPQVTTAAWHSVLDERSPIRLVAPRANEWVEVWRVDVGPVWHASFAGIPFIHAPHQGAAYVPEWRPWPGEEASVDLQRPEGVAGQTLTIDSSEALVTPGLRDTDVSLTLSLRSSRGGQHTLTLPADALLESLSINGTAQPIRQDGRKVTVPIVPGAQNVVLGWREAHGISMLFATSAIDLGVPSVNATTVLVPGGRWLLFVGGPRVGPAVLFWSELLVLLVVSLLLARIPWTPLRWWHWLLLAVGLSQASVVAGAVFVGWLLVLGWRARQPWETVGARTFNLRQVLLVAWTLAAMGILCASLYQGLLGAPDMQVEGNGSSASELRWFVDRSGATLATAWVASVPMLAYRGAMLAWALWIALALLRWLRWGWSAFSAGGVWKKRPRPIVEPVPPLPGVAPPQA
jgi:hypothetical protein